MAISRVDETFVRKVRQEHRRAWWCWPVTKEELARAAAPDPIDVEEEREQLMRV